MARAKNSGGKVEVLGFWKHRTVGKIYPEFFDTFLRGGQGVAKKQKK